MLRKILFIDRDGTLISEPSDEQVDSLEKLAFEPGVIAALNRLQNAGYELVMVTNQDGLGTAAFEEKDFNLPHDKMLEIFSSQGVEFKDILICPHFAEQGCDCRKPQVGLLRAYLGENDWDRKNSYVIGDRESDIVLADNLGIQSILYQGYGQWREIANQLTQRNRMAKTHRKTNETDIQCEINLDDSFLDIQTGIGFFDHMLEQLAKHGDFGLQLSATGDLHIDMHHTVEDVAITLGETMQKALGDKRGIARYGFLLPMDEANCQVSIDLSGRAYYVESVTFTTDRIGDMPTEMIRHFFRSFANALNATLHMTVTGDNNHHMAEAMFKALGRTIKQAKIREGDQLPTTKGLL